MLLGKRNENVYESQESRLLVVGAYRSTELDRNQICMQQTAHSGGHGTDIGEEHLTIIPYRPRSYHLSKYDFIFLGFTNQSFIHRGT